MLRWRKATALLGLLQLLPLFLAAQSPAITRLFPAQPDGYLTDRANLVDPSTASAITDLASRLRKATGAELAVVTLPTIENQTPGDVALTIGRVWGVGGKGEIGDSARNAGMVLLLVPRTSDHKGEIFLSTGRGVEGILTDGMVGRILDLMIPDLREGRYGPALQLGTRAVAATVAKGFGVSDSALAAADPFTKRSNGGGEDFPPMLVFIVIIIVIIVISNIGGSGGGRGGRRRRGSSLPGIIFGGGGGGWGGGGGFGGGGGGGFGGFGGGGGFSGGGAGRSF